MGSSGRKETAVRTFFQSTVVISTCVTEDGESKLFQINIMWTLLQLRDICNRLSHNIINMKCIVIYSIIYVITFHNIVFKNLTPPSQSMLL